VPELPETETIARDLHAALKGATISAVRVLRADVLRGTKGPAFSRALANARIERAWRRAKSIVIDLSASRHLVVTPRFTGTLLLDAADDYACISFTLADGRTLSYRDVRRLGTVALLGDDAFKTWSADLGPEPLDPRFTTAELTARLRRSSRAVKLLLMDQKKLAGVGNIYANEALWRARIAPSRPGARISAAEAAMLLKSIRGVLRESIAARGTTFRDFRDAYGARGTFAARLAVYGRGGLPCHRCSSPLSSSRSLGGRVSSWCARCQR
jgi:formamidopyrimidine-DNA glycosylase